MAFDRRYGAGLAVRLALLSLCLAGFAFSLFAPGLAAARIVAGALVLAAALALWRYIGYTNVEIARFISAVRFGDLSASFARPGAGSGFDQLGQALNNAVQALRDERAALSGQNRFYEALVDDVPTALLTIDKTGRIDTLNKAARRLFNRHLGVRADDFSVYGQEFVQAIEELPHGRQNIIALSLDIGPQRALVRAASLNRLGGTIRVIVVQPIQDALNAIELASQSDLIRVLTHEIMNSMTPVTSLARTAAQLIAAADPGNDPAITDARMAIETLAHRADGVMHFVETYRAITRPPQIVRKLFAATVFAAELQRLFAADPAWVVVRLTVELSSHAHQLDADPDLLAQIVINLLRNAADAAIQNMAANNGLPLVILRISALSAGRTQIEVEDNGAGVPPGLRHDVFLPFFTTKKTGTGVGLSLSRQVMLAHGGSIEVASGTNGGAVFRLTL